MARPSFVMGWCAVPAKKHIVNELLDRHPRSFGEEVGAKPASDRPADLFRLLIAAHLFSARISADIALAAAQALNDQGWTTPKKMADSTWEERTRTLNQSGYARYDERTSSMLGETVELLLDCYNGDLRQLREEAGHEPAQERRLLKEFKGIGDVGADIFFRDAQAAWPEWRPFVDDKAMKAAGRLDLADNAEGLTGLVAEEELPRLLSALVRTDLSNAHDAVLEGASDRG